MIPRISMALMTITLKRDSNWPLMDKVMQYQVALAIPLYCDPASHCRTRSISRMMIIRLVVIYWRSQLVLSSLLLKRAMNGISRKNIQKWRWR
jgi:hypothetical protein